MNFEILYFHDLTKIPSEIFSSFIILHTSLFGEAYTAELPQIISKKDQPLFLFAVSPSREVLGFKVGYLSSNTEFYSWTGGVHPSMRNCGIGSALIKRQHTLCHNKGIKKIQTKTKLHWEDMFKLNLKNGFEMTNIYLNQKGESVVILEKRL